MTSDAEKKPRSKFLRILKILGRGVVTGAADDDPSGIATYSQTGAQLYPHRLAHDSGLDHQAAVEDRRQDMIRE
jgi:hypothetical protein